jgi:predicted dehydrogenase
LARTGTHLLDLVRWVLVPTQGEVTDVSSLVTSDPRRGGNDETALLSLRFAGGASAEVSASILFDCTSRFEIYGTQGSALCVDTFRSDGAGSISVRDAPLTFPALNPYVAEFADFFAAIREGRDPEVPGEEGVRNVEILATAWPDQSRTMN